MGKEAVPFIAPIKERYRLNHPDSSKETFHVVLDLQDSSIEYEVGDCIGVYPSNPETIVLRILGALNASSKELVKDRDGQEHSFKNYLKHQANINRLTKKFILFAKERVDDSATKTRLEILTDPLHPENLQLYIESHEFVDFLEQFSPIKISPQECVDFLSPLIPRLYSISSSMKAVGKEVHLTVGLTQYEKNGDARFGTCSHFLCHEAPLQRATIPIYLHKAKDFILKKEITDKSIIMIGPGTGIAPFRGFMQERIQDNATGKHWLFFGERQQNHDFYYKDFWFSLVQQGRLRLDVAFSRDQKNKVYVQHKMLENARELWLWIHEGAYIYVCGDASRMAKDVELALLHIIEKEGSFSTEDARLYLKTLRQNKRYLRDVY